MSLVMLRAISCDASSCDTPGPMQFPDEPKDAAPGSSGWREYKVAGMHSLHVCPKCAAGPRPNDWPSTQWPPPLAD